MSGKSLLLLNFSHPLSAEQVRRIEEITGAAVEAREIKTQFDPAQPFAAQASALADAAGLSPQEWQTTPLVVNLPSLNFGAAALLAELHGRVGYFPAVLRLRLVPDALPQRFEVAEIMNLQAARDTARMKR